MTAHRTRILMGEEVIPTIEVSRIIGVHVSVSFLKECGVRPFTEGACSASWRKSDLPLIARAVADRIVERAK